MKTEKYIRKPFEVEGVQVTEENMIAVAKWCKGSLNTTGDGVDTPIVNHIKVKVQHPVSERQTQAFVGDWVLFSGKGGFKVYLDKAFKNHFDPSEEQIVYAMEDDPEQLAIAGVGPTVVNVFGGSTDDQLRQMIEAEQK